MSKTTAEVRIQVSPDATWRRASLLLGAATGGVLAWWLLAHGVGLASEVSIAAGFALVGSTLVASAAGAAFVVRLLRLPLGTLRWDGLGWWWAAEGTQPDSQTEGHVRVMIDLGRWVLLRFEAAAKESTPAVQFQWLALSASAGGHDWSGWRAMLLSRRAVRRQPTHSEATAA